MITLTMRWNYADALYMDTPHATLDDLREAVKDARGRGTARAARARWAHPTLQWVLRRPCEYARAAPPRPRGGRRPGLRVKPKKTHYLSPPPTCPSKGRVKLFSWYAVWSTPVCAKETRGK